MFSFVCVESVRGWKEWGIYFVAVVREMPGEKVLESAVARMGYRL